METIRISHLMLAMVMMMSYHDSSSQDFLFKVMAANGKIELKSADGSVTPAKVGFSIEKGATLVASDNSYVALLHLSGSAMELKGPFDYSISQLEEKVPPVSTSVASRLINFAVSRINEVDEDPRTNYKENLKAAAGVERALSEEMKVLLKYRKKSNRYYDEEVIIEWLPIEEAQSYELLITDVFSEELLRLSTKQLAQTIDTKIAGLNKERILLLRLTSDNGVSSALYRIERTSNDTRNEEIMQMYSGKSAVEELMLALYFEREGLYLDALKHYNRAAEESPASVYATLRDHFITTNSLGR